jgi:hypothetical protein
MYGEKKYVKKNSAKNKYGENIRKKSTEEKEKTKIQEKTTGKIYGKKVGRSRRLKSNVLKYQLFVFSSTMTQFMFLAEYQFIRHL